MKKAVIALGTNLGNRWENLSKAIRALELLPGSTTVVASSHIYETEPFETPDEQNNYLNMCIIVMTELSPHALLGACLGIEAAMGRKRKIKNGARVIDIDLLLYEDEEIHSEELTIPHPGIRNRAFVMVPLAELFPEKKVFDYDFAAAWQRVDKSGVERLG